jgi:hypothetical protein
MEATTIKVETTTIKGRSRFEEWEWDSARERDRGLSIKDQPSGGKTSDGATTEQYLIMGYYSGTLTTRV